MKKINLSSYLLAIFIIPVFVFTSCKKDNSSTPSSSNTITGIVAANPDLLYLSAAIEHAGLSAEYSTGAYTLFAPTNDAFKAAGYPSISDINAEDPDVLADIIYYHTIDDVIKVDDLLPGPNVPYETLNTDSVYITGNASGYYVNGAQLLTGDNIATNGVVHTINHLLVPPPGNIISTLQINPNLSFLVAAIERTREGSTDIFGLLTDDGPYTMFAPTNAAFIADGFPNIDAINSADPNVLASLLRYHILPVRNYSCEFYDGYTPATLFGNTVAVGASGGFTVQGNANETAAKMTSTDNTAYNGVVHVIDEVLHAF